MLDVRQQKIIVDRLDRIAERLHLIRGLIRQPALCPDILQQLAAAEAAMTKVGATVLKFHIEKCVPEGVLMNETERTRRLQELVDIFDRFGAS